MIWFAGAVIVSALLTAAFFLGALWLRRKGRAGTPQANTTPLFFIRHLPDVPEERPEIAPIRKKA